MTSNLNVFDFYEHEDRSLEYVLENILSDQSIDGSDNEFQHLQREYNSILLNGCDCISSKFGCLECHGRNYKWFAETGELVLDTDNSVDLIYECSSSCKCEPSKCTNRLVQKGPRAKLKIVHSNLFKSKGLFSSDHIPKGGFICEYAGEIISRKEAHNRLKKYEQNLDNYILFMTERIKEGHDKSSTTTIIDPTKRGNIGRYLNHSCNPNCEVRSVRIDCPIPKIAIFAKRDISAGEELCFHYNEGNEAVARQRRICLCGSGNCTGFMPYASD
ncbi:PREDICTED: probable histone-lysine N-methyltransferase set-23 isoform X1 [Bactrocera latifrons]|uniref:Putative histone-lysine N-methyltransferase set-23 n=1 Tax=Bactrocera latifrons TaxID=174628 RepID=A0A0K8U982_BACLA|nr:PREDICTED: probable histone-lysine N-methyltransferase set-23 isoform X1 [Bactrocera latifrons]